MIKLTQQDLSTITELTGRRDWLIPEIAKLKVIVDKGVTDFSLKVEGWNANGMGRATVNHTWYQTLEAPFGDEIADFALNQMERELELIETRLTGYGIDYQGPEKAA